jgi:hypothetical protein
MKRFRTGKVPNVDRPKGARNKVFRANLEKRRAEAKARQALTDKQTPQQRLAALDAQFGVGVGAVKERARLASYIKNPQLRFKITVNVAQAKEQLQKVTSAVKQLNRELKKVKVVNQRNPAAAPGVPNLPPLSTVVARVG